MLYCVLFFFFKQKTAYEMRISDWSSDVCSSDLQRRRARCIEGVPGHLQPWRSNPGSRLPRYRAFHAIRQNGFKNFARIQPQSCAAANVSQRATSPLSKPVRNQRTRCSELPCVNESVTTSPCACC